MSVHSGVFEQSLTRIYAFMNDPNLISFEDDVIFIIQIFIRKIKAVSPVNWELFGKLPAVLEKNKHQLNDLFDTVNLYMTLGKTGFVTEPEAIKVIVNMANVTLFTQRPS